MLIELRKKSVQFIGQEERAAYSNINCSMRATETEENVVTIGIRLFAFVEEPLSIEVPRPALPTLPGAREVGHLVPLALIVAMVCIMQTSAVASTFPSEKGGPDDGILPASAPVAS